MTASYHTPEVARITGIPLRTLDYWARAAILKPSVAEANGTGSERLYSFDDLIVITAVCSVPATDSALRKHIAARVRSRAKSKDVLRVELSEYAALFIDIRQIQEDLRRHV